MTIDPAPVKGQTGTISGPNSTPPLALPMMGSSAMTITGEYEDWLAAQGMSDTTIRKRVAFAEQRLREWPSFEDMERVEIARWLSTYDGWTRRTYHAHLKSIYNWLIDAGALDHNPLDRIRQAPLPELKSQALSPDELALVLGTARGDLRTWLLLGYLAGLRLHEVAKFHGRDITASTIRVVGKGGVVAWIPTHPELWAIAERYPRSHYWFPTRYAGRDHVTTSHIGNIVRAHFRALGIDDGAMHRLRHTYATTLIRNSVPTTTVQTLMRHAKLTTTQGYVKVEEAERAAGIGTLIVPPAIPHPGLSPAA